MVGVGLSYLISCADIPVVVIECMLQCPDSLFPAPNNRKIKCNAKDQNLGCLYAKMAVYMLWVYSSGMQVKAGSTNHKTWYY